MRDGKLHTGHRKRLKEKIKQNGFNSLSLHEVVEVFLFGYIPYKDTNEIAHRLVDSYGSIYNILNATPNELQSFDGIGQETAFNISLLPHIIELYNNGKKGSAGNLFGPKQMVEHFRKNFLFGKNEIAYLCFTDKNSNLIKISKIGEGTRFNLTIPKQTLVKEFNSVDAYYVTLVHTHPDSQPIPSMEDCQATRQVMLMANMTGMKFSDHLIISASEFFSFRNSELIENIEYEVKNFQENFNNGSKEMQEEYLKLLNKEDK